MARPDLFELHRMPFFSDWDDVRMILRKYNRHEPPDWAAFYSVVASE
jgi:hypothetical protein